MVLLLLAGEVTFLGGQYLTATLYDLALALTARTLSTARRRKEHAVARQCGQQRAACLNIELLFAVDGYRYIATLGLEVLRHQQYDDKQHYDHKEHCYACQYQIGVHFFCFFRVRF